MPQIKTQEKDRPFVSVIVPVYNGVEIIGECIEALLAQDYPKQRYEIIIVDNDSTDGTAEVIKCYPVKYVLEDRCHNAYGARNAGARQAKGEALAFCDADQVATQGWLSALLSHWSEPYAAFAGPYPMDVKLPTCPGRFFYFVWDNEHRDIPFDSLTPIDDWGCGNLCVRMADFQTLGGFGTDSPGGEDTRFCRRLTKLLARPILLIGAAVQYHRPSVTWRSIVRRQLRRSYGQQRGKEIGELNGIDTLTHRTVIVVLAWLSLPCVVVRTIACPNKQVGWQKGWKDELFTRFMMVVELIGRAACRLGVSPECFGKM